METFYITFHMNNGDEIEIQEVNDPSYDFSIVLKSTEKWFQSGNQIINLNNVNSIDIDTETQRQEMTEAAVEALSNWSPY